MSRAIKIESIVPGPRLCQKLPKEVFSKSIFMWYRSSATQNKWKFCARLGGCKYPWSNWVPAPTVDELLEKFPAIDTGELRIIPTYTHFVSHWELEVSCPDWNSTTHVKGKTFVAAVCKLYLSLRKEFERGKKWRKRNTL